MKDQVAVAFSRLSSMRWRTVGSTRRTLLLAFGVTRTTTAVRRRAPAIGRVLEERGIELSTRTTTGRLLRIVPAAGTARARGWLMRRPRGKERAMPTLCSRQRVVDILPTPHGGTSLEVLSRAITAICDIEWPTRVTDLLAAQLVERLGTADEIAAKQRDALLSAIASPAASHPLVTTTCAPTQIGGSAAPACAAGYVGQHQLPACSRDCGRRYGALP